MAGNMRRQPVSYRPFRVQPLLSEGLLPVSRDGGELERKVAEGMFRVAGIAGEIADRKAQREGALAGEQNALDGGPRVDVALPARVAPGQPFRTDDPVATDLPPQARAFLNTIAGGESNGRYNVRYTPQGGALFDDLSRHPGIMEPGPHGKSSAAGRYQHTLTTWNRQGGGDFSPYNQDHRAWSLAQEDYQARTGRPLLADLEAGGVTNEMLSTLTPTWQAFKGNRSRHIATYQDSLQRMVGRGEITPPEQNVTPQVDTSVQAPRVTAQAGSWKPSGRDTVYGQAYDAAGTRTYLQKLNLGIERGTAALFDSRKGDPHGLAEDMQELKSQLAGTVFPEIRAEFELTFDRRAGALVMQAQRELEKKQADENRAAFLDRTSVLETDLDRQLKGLDTNDPVAAQKLDAIQRQISDHYDSAVEHDLITPSQAAEAKRRSAQNAEVGWYASQAQTRHADDIAGYRDSLREDYAAGRLGLDVDGWTALEARLVKMEADQRRDEAKAAKDLAERGAAIAARVEAGFDYDPAELGRLQLDANTAPDGQQIVDTTLGMVGVAEMFRDLPIGDARARIAQMRDKMGANPTDAQIATLAYAQKRLGELEQLIAKDPVAYEVATGRTRLGAIDTSTPEALVQSLSTRRDQMEAISERYGAPFQFFRPHERTLLATALTENPDGFPDFVVSLRETLGDRTPAALAELADDAPTLAHAAGLSIATGNNAIAVDIARAIAAKKQGTFTAKMPAQDRFVVAAGPMLEGALAGHDRVRAATMATAQLLFEADANRIGFDPSDVHKADTPANMAWRRAVERSLGAEYVGGRQTGGIGAVNGSAIVVPTGMEPAEPQRLMRGITPAVLEQLPPIRTANGVDITAAQLRRARLVTEGDGVYRVTLDDPNGWDPQYLVGEDGGFWTLDLRALRDLTGSDGPRRAMWGWQTPDAIP